MRPSDGEDIEHWRSKARTKGAWRWSHPSPLCSTGGCSPRSALGSLF